MSAEENTLPISSMIWSCTSFLVRSRILWLRPSECCLLYTSTTFPQSGKPDFHVWFPPHAPPSPDSIFYSYKPGCGNNPATYLSLIHIYPLQRSCCFAKIFCKFSDLILRLISKMCIRDRWCSCSCSKASSFACCSARSFSSRESCPSTTFKICSPLRCV